MKSVLIVALIFFAIAVCAAQAGTQITRMEAEYYVDVYAKHYRVPVALVRSIVDRESNWQVCTVSPKGAVGLMQLMPSTAQRLGVTDRCNPDQNVSGGIRYLAWLMRCFHNDFRLVAAAYYVGEHKIIQRRLSYRNPKVRAYVSSIRTACIRDAGIEPAGRTSRRKEM